MKQLAIKAENISKQYRLGQIGTGTLSHDLNRFWNKLRGNEDPYLQIGEVNDRSIKGESEYVWSLRDINFEIEQGDAIGIIGRNGAGKSTLLKLLSKVTRPTSGSFKINGRIASLLEVGTGFNPELTGRENIYLNGAILGMRSNEITRKFDEIVAFSGVDRYIDTPVKRYSSGMYVRLAFAVAAHLESEILIVDEVLAVGDAEFQKKCLGKMGDVSKSEGRTVLFVSHNMAAVQYLCNKGLLLDKGKCVEYNSVAMLIGDYMNIFDNTNEKKFIDFESKDAECYVKRVEIDGSQASEISNFIMGDIIRIKVYVKLNFPYDDIKSSIIISNNFGTNIIAIRSFEMSNNKFDSNKDFHFNVTIKDLKLMPGKYKITVGLANKQNTIEIKENCLSFNIIESDIYHTGKIPSGNYLLFSNDSKWELVKE
jgi:lipopolysaccharide transport system ATP-binding protein